MFLFFHFDIVELLLLELLVESFYVNFVAETFFNSCGWWNVHTC